MKILFVDTFCHWKNKLGFKLLCQENPIEAIITDNPIHYQDSYDLVIVPSNYISYKSFPNASVIMYGPHNFVFTKDEWKGPQQRFPAKCVYNLLSDWILKVQDEFGGMSLRSITFPYPVDIQRFCPLESSLQVTYDCFIYFKGRDQELLRFAESSLTSMGLHYTILRYGSYTEDEYLTVLQSSRFGLWIGSHESQGFALQEALSANVPLIVWNVKSMFDEYNKENEISYKEDQRLYKLKATSIPYWDNRCGEFFTSKDEFFCKVFQMNESYSKYKPREYILETLSSKACYKRLVDILSLTNTNTNPETQII